MSISGRKSSSLFLKAFTEGSSFHNVRSKTIPVVDYCMHSRPSSFYAVEVIENENASAYLCLRSLTSS